MKFAAPQKALFSALDRIAPFAARKSPTAYLEHVHIQATNAAIGKGTITISATDLYTAGTTSIEADVVAPGVITVHALDLLARVKNMPVGDVTVDAQSQKQSVLIKAAGSARRFQLTTGDNDADPPFGERTAPAVDARKITMPTAVLLRRIEEVLPCISTDEARPHLNSALCQWRGNTFAMVATDGHRLSISEAEIEKHEPFQAIIPRDAILRVRAMADPKHETVSVALDKTHVFIDFGPSGSVRAKLFDGDFPSYEGVVPKDISRSARVNREKLIELVRAAAIVDPKDGRVLFTFKPGFLQLSSESPEHGSAYDEMEIDCDHNLAIAMNAKYVEEAAEKIDAEEVTVFLPGSEMGPLRIDAHHRDGFDVLYVIMPMR